ncbi:ribonuclease H2 subunit A [Crepidotus variabilis]|uniref:Ribonuclease n=1 Tax=Crepidotus variabilis TaxID=179855 RepID=A0A9P6EP11_9AGAR|nr:ribonuclease H2 subunit A [Crepidotus variabilis]
MSDTESEESPKQIPSVPDLLTPLTESYTYHSPQPTAKGPYILGVDEAGRGPVLGPLVYGVAFCPESYKEELEELGFADSKALNATTRSTLLDTLRSDPKNLGWSVRVVAPQAISSGMLRRPPTNLNRQSEEATVLLIREILAKGIKLSEVYVDALGTTSTYERYLSGLFPGIQFTVTPKADSKYKIVGAASIGAKVTRDFCVEGWHFEESNGVEGKTWSTALGSGYPSDPNTQAWLKASLDPVFGFPRIVRFSWSTVKNLLDKSAHVVKWYVKYLTLPYNAQTEATSTRTDEGQASLIKAFESGKGLDKDRCALARDLHIRSVDTL